MNSCAFIIPKDASHLLPNHATKTVHRDFLGTHYSQVWQESKMSSQCHWKKIQNLREILETGLVNGDEKKYSVHFCYLRVERIMIVIFSQCNIQYYIFERALS